MQQPLPAVDWLVEPLIPHPSRTVVFGEFGSLKSWMLLDLGLHIAAGKYWLKPFTIPQGRSVLYIDEEMAGRELRRRVKLLGEGGGFNGQALPFRAISQLGLQFNRARVELLLQGLKHQDFDPELVIVETFRRVLAGSENDAEDVSGFWDSVLPILAAGKSLIVSHHMRKPNPQGQNEVRHRASGSTDILAGADCGFALTQCLGEVIQVECVKERMAKVPPSFVFSLKDHTPGREAIELHYEGEPGGAAHAPSEEARAFELIGKFYETADDHTAETKDVMVHLASNGISERTGERAWKHFKMIRAEQVSRGKYRLRDSGLEAA